MISGKRYCCRCVNMAKAKRVDRGTAAWPVYPNQTGIMGVRMQYEVAPFMQMRDPDGYYVPINKLGPTYIIYVGDNAKRFYTDDTLPDVVKTMLGLIYAMEPETGTDDYAVQSFMMHLAELRKNPELGFRVSESWCVLRFTLEEFNATFFSG